MEAKKKKKRQKQMALQLVIQKKQKKMLCQPKLQKKKAKKRRKIMFIAIAVLLVAGFVFGRAVYRISELKKEKAQAEAKLEALQEKLDQLEDELTRVTSDEYIEQQARTHLRMIYPGETVYIVVPPEETSGNKAAN